MENKKYNITFKKVWIHLSTILKHKYYVFSYARRCGITWLGIIHDLSKFSPTEFWTNVRYVEKGVSPIDIQKRELGYAAAWFHHKGHNPHHYEYWMDRFDDGCYVTRMPYKYSVECLCDYLGANKAYNGKNASYNGQYDWWQVQREKRAMHPDNIAFLDSIIIALKEAEDNNRDINTILNKKYLKCVYQYTLRNSYNDKQIKINK